MQTPHCLCSFYKKFITDKRPWAAQWVKKMLTWPGWRWRGRVMSTLKVPSKGYDERGGSCFREWRRRYVPTLWAFYKNRKCSLQNENRMKLLSSLEDTSALFTGPAKISALGALGESYVSDVSNHFIFRRVLHLFHTSWVIHKWTHKRKIIHKSHTQVM